jgi:SAM-dependent methyltransferase
MSRWIAEHEYYAGHRIAACPGTHRAVVEAAISSIPKDASILDMGSYTGALLRRFRDSGYADLTGADLANHLTETGIPFVQADFNQPFADKFDRTFDCIIVCEVIEHLDDPRRFLAECRKLLNDGGIVIVSTPNIAFFEGRIKFLLKGELFGFGGKNYQIQRHITPISREQFPLLFEECGLEEISFSTAASFASPLRKVATFPIWATMRALFGPLVLGETVVVVGRKANGSERLTSNALWGKPV